MALPSTCPIPSNINPLSPNGFNFSIIKLPEVSFFCQEVNLPDITLPSVDINTPLSINPIAGDIISYGDLTVQFLIDENMANYKAIFNWLKGLGFPNEHKEYSDFIQTQTHPIGWSRLSREFSDGVLSILGSNNQSIQSVNFVDLVPINLSSLTFQSTNQDVQYLVGTASFKYDHYEFID